MKSEFNYHTPALLQETINYLNIKKGKLYVDATVGGGGHLREIIKRGGRILGLDCDQEAIDYSQKFLDPNSGKIYKENFINLKQVWQKQHLPRPSAILFDLGTSFHQLFNSNRGFSFQADEILDMRMNQELKVKAIDLLQVLSAKELTLIFKKFGEEKYSQTIAQTIKKKPVKTTRELAQICQDVYQKYHVRSSINPATKVFQALRIAVNDELNSLQLGLQAALDCLDLQGRLAVISFQGLEDKIVKDFFIDNATRIKILTKKPIVPGKEEISRNPRSRSAKLRVAEKNA